MIKEISSYTHKIIDEYIFLRSKINFFFHFCILNRVLRKTKVHSIDFSAFVSFTYDYEKRWLDLCINPEKYIEPFSSLLLEQSKGLNLT